MGTQDMNRSSVNKAVLIILVVFISAVFLSMIRSFLMAIFLAGIFSALAHPLYDRFVKWFRGRRGLASITTLILILGIIWLAIIVKRSTNKISNNQENIYTDLLS